MLTCLYRKRKKKLFLQYVVCKSNENEIHPNFHRMLPKIQPF